MKRNLKEAEIKTDRDFIGMGKDEASSYEIDCELCLKSFSGAHFALGKKRYCLDCMICEYCQKIIPQKHWLVY